MISVPLTIDDFHDLFDFDVEVDVECIKGEEYRW